MRIISYEYHDTDNENHHFHFSKVNFGKFNLLVGDTGTGKTRFLNTLFNLGSFVANKNAEAKAGYWNMVLLVNSREYNWELEVTKDLNNGQLFISKDNLFLIQDDGHKTPIIERSLDSFVYNRLTMPKMTKDQPSIRLLQEEEIISPLYKGFCKILRRKFSQDVSDNSLGLQGIPRNLLTRSKKEITLEKLFFMNFGLNATLYLLSKHFTDRYNKICQYYKSIFPFIDETGILDISTLHPEISSTEKIPVFCIKEKGCNEWYELPSLSSGMQKVLLILTDMYVLPNDGIYLIDEYENSLGVSAINFFPEILLNIDTDVQLFITSHHPYIINNIPVKDWYIFHRNGGDVSIRYGDELVNKYSKSKQEAFIQLINDPFYKKGVE